MQLTLFPGYPDLVGRRQIFTGFGQGPPTTYTASAGPNPTGGDTIFVPGYERYIDCILEVPLDPTGQYYGVAIPSFAGPRAVWKIFYYTTAGALVTTGTTALAATSFIVSGFMGEY